MRHSLQIISVAFALLASASAQAETTVDPADSSPVQERGKSREAQNPKQQGDAAKPKKQNTVKPGTYGREARARTQERRKQQADKPANRGTRGAAQSGAQGAPDRFQKARELQNDKGSRIDTTSKRAKALREQKAKAEAGLDAGTEDYQKRLEAARQKQAAEQQTAERVKAAREQAYGSDKRAAGARQQYTEAQRAQRIASARENLADLDAGQSQSAKRFLLEQEKHHVRLARIDRIEALLTAKGDTANLARVAELRKKELAAFSDFQGAMRRSLSERQAAAIESTGEVGTRKRITLQGSAGQAKKLGKMQNAEKRGN